MANWGTGDVFSLFVHHPTDPIAAKGALARFERNACTPQMVGEILRANAHIDIREVLSTITVPTLVMHNALDPLLEVGHGRYLGDHIPGARYVEGPFACHGTWQDSESQWIRDAVADFLGRTAPEPPDVDRVLATFDGPARAIRCTAAINDSVRDLGLGLRAGVHTGEVERRGDDITGLGVVIARRICDLARDGEVLASRTVKELVTGSGITFADRGAHALKGVPDDWQLYAVAT